MTKGKFQDSLCSQDLKDMIARKDILTQAVERLETINVDTKQTLTNPSVNNILEIITKLDIILTNFNIYEGSFQQLDAITIAKHDGTYRYVHNKRNTPDYLLGDYACTDRSIGDFLHFYRLLQNISYLKTREEFNKQLDTTKIYTTKSLDPLFTNLNDLTEALKNFLKNNFKFEGHDYFYCNIIASYEKNTENKYRTNIKEQFVTLKSHLTDLKTELDKVSKDLKEQENQFNKTQFLKNPESCMEEIVKLPPKIKEKIGCTTKINDEKHVQGVFGLIMNNAITIETARLLIDTYANTAFNLQSTNFNYAFNYLTIPMLIQIFGEKLKKLTDGELDKTYIDNIFYCLSNIVPNLILFLNSDSSLKNMSFEEASNLLIDEIFKEAILWKKGHEENLIRFCKQLGGLKFAVFAANINYKIDENQVKKIVESTPNLKNTIIHDEKVEHDAIDSDRELSSPLLQRLAKFNEEHTKILNHIMYCNPFAITGAAIKSGLITLNDNGSIKTMDKVVAKIFYKVAESSIDFNYSEKNFPVHREMLVYVKSKLAPKLIEAVEKIFEKYSNGTEDEKEIILKSIESIDNPNGSFDLYLDFITKMLQIATGDNNISIESEIKNDIFIENYLTIEKSEKLDLFLKNLAKDINQSVPTELEQEFMSFDINLSTIFTDKISKLPASLKINEINIIDHLSALETQDQGVVGETHNNPDQFNN